MFFLGTNQWIQALRPRRRDNSISFSGLNSIELILCRLHPRVRMGQLLTCKSIVWETHMVFLFLFRLGLLVRRNAYSRGLQSILPKRFLLFSLSIKLGYSSYVRVTAR